MKEILLTSSVLILAITLLRALFRSRVTKRFQYALWGLVLLRLLIPVQFGSLSFSVSSLAQDSEPIAVIEQQISQPVAKPQYDVVYQNVQRDFESKGYDVSSPETVTQITQQTEARLDLPTWEEVLKCVWIAGIAAMAVWFTAVNLRFRRSARKNAVRLELDAPVPVYISSGVTSPCLTGLFRPVIYLTPAAAEDERLRRHVLTHELTHYRHGDHIWSLLRSLCLCVYWFDPLVWVAAVLSRRDCELACDEGALKRLGENERLSYGRSLVDVVAGGLSPSHLMEAATAMNESKRQLTERVNRIVKKPKFYVTAAICLFIAAAIIAGCTFAGNTPKTSTEKNDDLLLETVTQYHAFDGYPENSTWTRNYYDKNGHLTRILESGESLSITEVDCDEKGNPIRKTQLDENGTVVTLTEYTYDADGNELTCRITMGDALVREMVRTYDQRGNLSSLTDTAGTIVSRTEYTYDSQDRLSRVVFYNNGEEDLREEYSYSDDGLTCTVISYDNGSEEEAGRKVRTRSADGLSAEYVVTLADGTEEQRSVYAYDEAGNCIFQQLWQKGSLCMTMRSRYIQPGGEAVYTMTYLPGEEVNDLQLLPFPGTAWGMTPEELIEALGLKEGEYKVYLPDEEDAIYSIRCSQMKVYGADADVGFIFDNATGVFRLYLVTVGLPETTDFNALEAEMTMQYGAPIPGSVLKWNSDVTQYDLFSEGDKAIADALVHNSSYARPAASIFLTINNHLYATTYQGEQTNYSITFWGTNIQFRSDEIFDYLETQDSTEPAEVQTVPEDCSPANLVTTWKEVHLEWEIDTGSTEHFDARIPTIYPFSSDAIAINAHIAEKYGAMMDENVTAAVTGYSAYPLSIDYEANLYGNVLSLVITTDTGTDYTEYEVYNFWLETGEYALTMDDAAMARYYLDLSYPEFLYAATQFSLDCFDQYYAETVPEAAEAFKQQYLEDHGMPLGHNPLDLGSYDLCLNSFGQIMLKFNRISMAGADSYPTVLPFVPVETDKAESYTWLFNIHADGAYATAHAHLLCDAFLSDPEEFTEQILRQPDDTIDSTAQRLAYGAWDNPPAVEAQLREALEDIPDSEFKATVLQRLDALD